MAGAGADPRGRGLARAAGWAAPAARMRGQRTFIARAACLMPSATPRRLTCQQGGDRVWGSRSRGKPMQAAWHHAPASGTQQLATASAPLRPNGATRLAAAPAVQSGCCRPSWEPCKGACLDLPVKLSQVKVLSQRLHAHLPARDACAMRAERAGQRSRQLWACRPPLCLPTGPCSCRRPGGWPLPCILAVDCRAASPVGALDLPPHLPALLSITSSAPKRSRAACTRRSTSSSLLTSQTCRVCRSSCRWRVNPKHSLQPS